MEPARGFWSNLCSLVHFLPFFLGLLLLGVMKGVIFCPVICVVMTIGNSGVILGLWPAHAFWTYYCTIRSKLLGPLLKTGLCFCITVMLVLWPVASMIGSFLTGLIYGFLSPLVATFEAVGEGKGDKFIHCLIDGTWSSVKGSFTVVRDFADVCFHSYFSIMDDLTTQEPQDEGPLDMRFLSLPGALIIGLLGVIVDVPVIFFIALYKSPFMLFKGWHRLIHDLIGREGPFLETACVPFAGLAILLWPLIVIGAVLASLLSGIPLGGYAAVVTYQESSALSGLSYIVSSISIFDEYCNDMLDMPEGSCFPRLPYRKNEANRSGSISRKTLSDKGTINGKPLARIMSLRSSLVETKPLELFDYIFEDCKRHGELLVREGPIGVKDIEDWTSNRSSNQLLSVGLPAYCMLQGLIRSSKANCNGYLLSDNVTEITSSNRPREIIFDRFFDPLMTIKDQIRALELSDDEENYLRRFVLLGSDPDRMKDWPIGSPPSSNIKCAAVEALGRRLMGIARLISRFPTFRRRFDDVLNSVSSYLTKHHESDSFDRPTFRSVSSGSSASGKISHEGNPNAGSLEAV